MEALMAQEQQASVENSPSVPTTTYRTASVDGLKVFYREAGNPKSPAVLLLHGFPTFRTDIAEMIGKPPGWQPPYLP
jgi:hypothetical protein